LDPVELAMGEISKRCKHQWMWWTAAGLEALLQLRLVNYANPDHSQAFKHDLLQRSTKINQV
jgi:hypothetical protein